MLSRIFLSLGVLFLVALVPAVAQNVPAKPPKAEPGKPIPVMTDITEGLKLIDEIDPAKVEPAYQSQPDASQVVDILGQAARVLPPGDKAKAISYILGKGKGLAPGKSYILTIEYPNDVPRTMFVANRGSDYERGWATGPTFGDVRSQYTEATVESLNYPQSGQWETYKQYFQLLNRFQGIKGARDKKIGSRPGRPEDGFNVVIFQAKQINDPRSEGAAIGKIRLYEVPDPNKLAATINYPPDGLPRRHIFWREEMADLTIQGKGEDNGVDDSIDWFLAKMKMAKILGINTFTKDLLEFGFNQGWETGDQNWVMNAQPPNVDLWNRLVPVATAEGLEVLPYYEYKGAIGLAPDSLAKQRRAHKLYHGKTGENYTGVYWTEPHNADLTDPDTLEDAKRLLDKTVVELKEQGDFAGVAFRTRNNHLPVSFSEDAIARFKTDNAADEQAQTATQMALIISFQGDKALYNKYIEWWFKKRAEFFTALRDYLREKLGRNDVQVIFIPWVSETIPVVHNPEQPGGHAGVVTDDVAWWRAYAEPIQNGWWRWHLNPSSYNDIVANDWYGQVLVERSHDTEKGEGWHSAPTADPENYQNIEDVTIAYPIGRQLTVANPKNLEKFRSAKGGLTVVRFYPLNEESENDKAEPSPFDHLIGYLSVDVDRAGPHMVLDQARAVAFGGPTNIAYLSGSSWSTGFPEVLRRFNQAFLAVPALPSKIVEGASSDPEVVVRETTTPKDGTYYYVVNTAMGRKTGVTVKFPAKGAITNLVTNTREAGEELKLDLDSADLRAYRVGP